MLFKKNYNHTHGNILGHSQISSHFYTNSNGKTQIKSFLYKKNEEHKERKKLFNLNIGE